MCQSINVARQRQESWSAPSLLAALAVIVIVSCHIRLYDTDRFKTAASAGYPFVTWPDFVTFNLIHACTQQKWLMHTAHGISTSVWMIKEMWASGFPVTILSLWILPFVPSIYRDTPSGQTLGNAEWWRWIQLRVLCNVSESMYIYSISLTWAPVRFQRLQFWVSVQHKKVVVQFRAGIY